MGPQGLHQLLAAGVEDLFVDDGNARSALVVDDDGFQTLGTHHRSHPPTASVAAGTVLGVVDADASIGHQPLSGHADADDAHLFPKLCKEERVGLVQPFGQPLIGRWQEFRPVLIHLEEPELALLPGLSLHHDGDPQAGQLLASHATGVGLLDGACEGGLAAYGDAARGGGGGAGDDARGDDDLIVGPQGMAGGRHLIAGNG
nr:hypothetical protein [Candidatus Hakubella thermalkaliphila]